MAAPPLELTMKLQKFIIERQKINDRVKRGQARAMVRSLAFVRRTARRDVLRRRKRISEPGKAPSIRSKDPKRSLRFILFAYDPRTNSGVVGPIDLPYRGYAVKSSRAVPGTLQHGGTQKLFEESTDGGRTWSLRRRSRRSSRGQAIQRRTRTAKIKARPFMDEALDREQKKGNIVSPFADVLGG